MTAFLRYWPGVFLVAIPFLYSDALLNLWERWSTETEYGHGILIPLVSLYIAWDRREQILRRAGGASGWGPLLTLLALLALIAGEISALFALKQVSLVLLLLGLAYAWLGAPAARLLNAPILILLFAIPPPYFLEAVLTARLQLVSSELGVVFIRWLGMPVFLSGNVIDLGVVQLEVVEACSGLRFLYPLMSIGFIVAYFYRAHWSKRLLVFLSTVPITVLMNSLRIALTALLVERYGQVMVEGTVHDAEGWLTFGGCLVLLFVEILLLELLTTRRSVLDIMGTGTTVTAPPHATQSNRYWPVAVSLALLILAGGGLRLLANIQHTDLPDTHLSLFPNQLGDWHGRSMELDPDVVRKLKFSDHLMLNYQRSDLLEPVNLYVAFYANQRNGESPHSPRVCIPGGGWEIESFERTEVDGRPVNRVLISREGQKQLVYYWFAERGTVVANEYVKKWMLLRDFIKTGRSDGALVRVVIPVVDNFKIEQSENTLRSFIALAHPVVMQYLPDSSY
jgi:exosortase D (VPLPA-CTERM-specific)